MKPDYKEELNRLVEKKKKEIPTSFSETGVTNIFSILQHTPDYLVSFSTKFTDKSSLEPIIEGKRSFKETLIHFLNIETLNYTTIYPAFLLHKPTVHPLHAERDLNRLGLFANFQLKELLEAFCLERKKTVNFLRSLQKTEWQKQLIEENKTREETIYWRARGLAIHDFTHVQILTFQINMRS